MASDVALEARRDRGAVRPYAPSWMDEIIGWLERLPGPAWIAYVGLAVAIGVVLGSFPWLGGQASAWTIDPYWALSAVYPTYTLAATAYLNGAARRALASFQPALDAPEGDLERLSYELTTFPGPAGVVVGLGTAVIVAAWRVFEPVAMPGEVMALRVLEAIGSCFSYALVGVFLARTVRQLRLVSRIQSLARTIDLFRPAPLYAFADLTVWTAIVILAVPVFDSLFPTATDPPTTAIQIVNIVGEIGLATIVFVAPLVGMQRRIAAEKTRLLAECGQRMKTLIAELHVSVDGRDLSSSGHLNESLASLVIERTEIERISTWPWRSTTFGAFLTAIVVPVAVWFITRVLDRLL